MTVNAPAKINLYLDVLGKLENGYHTIESIMQAVSLYDTVEVEADGKISLECNESEVPLDERNLAYKAAIRFFDKTGINGGAKIKIEKRIPVSSGLAGGSTDAGATLIALNKIYGDPLTEEELLAIGATLGADVPFCMKGGCVLCRGIGEEMTALDSVGEYNVVIARGGEGVSTPAAYKALDEMYGDGLADKFADVNKTIDALDKRDIESLAKSMYNVFEDVVLGTHSCAGYLKNKLDELGAVKAMMSGSGPAVFALFDSAEKAENAAEALRSEGYKAYAVKTV